MDQCVPDDYVIDPLLEPLPGSQNVPEFHENVLDCQRIGDDRRHEHEYPCFPFFNLQTKRNGP